MRFIFVCSSGRPSRITASVDTSNTVFARSSSASLRSCRCSFSSAARAAASAGAPARSAPFVSSSTLTTRCPSRTASSSGVKPNRSCAFTFTSGSVSSQLTVSRQPLEAATCSGVRCM